MLTTVIRDQVLKLDDKWKSALLISSARESTEQESDFLDLVDAADEKIDFEVAVVLLKTFIAKPDYGTQERVVSVLSSGRPEIVIKAILQELPRLVAEASEWAFVLMGTEVEFRPALTARLLLQAEDDVKNAASTVLCHEEFLSLYPNAPYVIRNGNV